MGRFGQHSTGRQVVEETLPAANGKTIVITGPSVDSIGANIALGLTPAKPAQIFLCGRTESKISPVIEAFRKENPETKLTYIKLDLGDLESVRSAVKEIKDAAPKIDYLFCNAGIMCVPYSKTKQGLEMQFGTNFLGHFLFSNLLAPSLIAAGKGARIVITSSTAANLSDVIWDDLDYSDGKTYHPWVAYGASNTAKSLLGVALSKRLYQPHGIAVLHCQPGMPMTSLYTHLNQEEGSLFSLQEGMRLYSERVGNPEDEGPGDQKTLEECAGTLLVAALDEDLGKESGKFIKNCEPIAMKPWVTDAENAEKLWAIAEKLVGQQFQY